MPGPSRSVYTENPFPTDEVTGVGAAGSRDDDRAPADERPAEADPSRQMAHLVELVGRELLEVVVLLRMFTPNGRPNVAGTAPQRLAESWSSEPAKPVS
jgi:hypothetical protein